MKSRTGFISNSSSSNFIIPLEKLSNDLIAQLKTKFPEFSLSENPKGYLFGIENHNSDSSIFPIIGELNIDYRYFYYIDFSMGTDMEEFLWVFNNFLNDLPLSKRNNKEIFNYQNKNRTIYELIPEVSTENVNWIKKTTQKIIFSIMNSKDIDIYAFYYQNEEFFKLIKNLIYSSQNAIKIAELLFYGINRIRDQAQDENGIDSFPYIIPIFQVIDQFQIEAASKKRVLLVTIIDWKSFSLEVWEAYRDLYQKWKNNIAE